MPELTRNQGLMNQAISNVRSVQQLSQGTKDVYGGLCHKFPVMIRTCGLCQALAFIESKTTSGNADRSKAHQLLTQHISAVLSKEGIGEGKNTPSAVVSALPMRQYILATRLLLSAWIYYKRFAESILGATADADKGGQS